MPRKQEKTSPKLGGLICNTFNQQVINTQNREFHGGPVVQGLPWWFSGKESTCQCRDTGDLGLILHQNGPLEKEMTTHSNILAWEIPWTEEPGRLLSMESQKSQTRVSD